MSSPSYLPIFELTRGDIVESIHYGAIAVADATGKLVASFGNPDTVTYLRSSAKPFQAMPFIAHGGQTAFQLTPREIALMAASHSGTDEHVAVARSIQMKTGVDESDLLCGVHMPAHEPTVEAMRERKEQPTPNRHNCSGKHSGMLAFIRLRLAANEPVDDSLPYIDPRHPIQREILASFAEMCRYPVEQVSVGIDGCSAPNFAVPLRNAALGFARLCDPETGEVRPPERAAACRTITSAMIFNPDMVGGPGRFDTLLMEVGKGRFVVKGGAEGYQAIGIMPGAMGPGSPALGVAFKVSDGDLSSRARPAIALEVLRQLGALSEDDLNQLAGFGPSFAVHNWRKLEVGIARPRFQLEHHG